VTEATEPGPLRLRAVDKADLEVFAAVLQDALLPIMDVTFQPSEARFVAVANRFRWENRDGAPERVLCALRVEHTRAARIRGIDRTNRANILNLLSISLKQDTEEQRLSLIFAGGGEIELTIDAIALSLEDLGEPWPAQSKPDHET